MRNIFVTDWKIHSTASRSSARSSIVTSAWNSTTNDLIYASGPTGEGGRVDLVKIQDDGPPSLIATWNMDEYSPTSADNRILGMHYFADHNLLQLAFSNGDIISVSLDTSAVEIVGTVDLGIQAVAWAPDEEILAVVTAARSLLIVSREFELIAEVLFAAEDVASSQQVSVGWGKEETQFKGKRAKANMLRDPTVPEKVDQGKLSNADDGSVRISWRGDGAFFAVCSTDEDCSRRLIRIFDREGHLESVAQPINGLESPISWRPSGSLIAGIQRFSDRLDVVFFERNGLRHGEFTLSLDPAIVTETSVLDVAWNGDSTILAISFFNRVQLWTRGNYHWYLKHDECFDLPSSPLPKWTPRLDWHPEIPLKFACTFDDFVVSCAFVWDLSIGSTRSPGSFGLVGVVDGSRLKLTPLSLANIPPPMAFQEAHLDAPLNEIAICPTGSIVAVLCGSSIYMFTWDITQKHASALRSHGVPIKLSDPVDNHWRQICFVDEQTIAIVQDSVNGTSRIRVLTFDLSGELNEDRQSSQLEFSVSRLVPLGDDRSALYQDQAGGLYQLSVRDMLGHAVHINFPERCGCLGAILVDEELLAFGLTTNGTLHANERLLETGCTSFLASDDYLVFTTTNNQIKFVHMLSHAHDFDVPMDSQPGDERCRNIETGARLIQMDQLKSSVTLQMPRGNLETIYPRILVLTRIRKAIRDGAYRDAFLACREHRVDLNILYDHSPQSFLSSIGSFVQQVKKVEHIDLFLSSLRNEDVTISMYRDTTSGYSAHPVDPEAPKVNLICERFIEVLSCTRSKSNIQNILTAYVCKSPPDHEAALRLVGDLRGDAQDLYEQAIQHICFLTDTNKLYDTALGMYHLEMALVIAQQSQMDPREYLPFLQRLQQLKGPRMSFAIDDHLGRYTKALKHLVAGGSGDFDEVKDYVLRNSLYRDALTHYTHHTDEFKIIMRMFADRLLETSCFREAGFAYESLEEFSLAAEAYFKAVMWQECLSAAKMQNLPRSKVLEFGNSLAASLIENNEHENAARIQLEYLADACEAARTLCKGSFFSEATRILSLHGKSDMLTEIVDIGLQEMTGTITELLADCKSQLVAQHHRLVELRQKKEKDPLTFFDGCVTEADAPDNVSLAPTNATSSASLFTKYTGKTNATARTGDSRRSAKNQRREERKRARGKKGTVYEEEYLVASLRRLSERVEGTRAEITRLLEGLVRRNMRDQAVAVQVQLLDVLSQLKTTIDDVFKSKSQLGSESVQNSQDDPVVSPFKELSLI